VQQYYITDRLAAGWTTHQLLECIKRNIDAGVDFIQVREKDLCGRTLFDLASRVVELASGSSTRVLVNDRTDIACAARAHGVHLRSGSIPPERLRPIVDSDFLIAVSCHTLSDVDQAQSADFVVFGPVFASPGKNTPVGIEGLQAAASRSRVPVFALGGVNHDDALTCIAAGAAGFAGIRLFQRCISADL
jgi:thiamine-phosphate pyrophosphorylase